MDNKRDAAMPSAYADLMERVKDISRLGSVACLLDWDQETYMPPGGVQARAEQSALIAGLAHERLVADETGRLLQEARADENDFVAETNLRETRRAYDRASKVPTELVKEITHTGALAKAAWVKAREESDFATFAPHLGKLVELKKRVAEYVGYESEPYDALMDEFEPGAVSSEIEALFADLRGETVALLEKLNSSSSPPDASILSRNFPRKRQEELSRKVAEALNFDFASGRSDVSVHPFCETIGGPGDVRITTRFMESFLPGALFGTIHETGHALYEQGLPREHIFTPMCEAVSLGIHESQSRLWENLVGRGRAFWSHQWDDLKAMFPEALGDVSMEEFYRAINTVRQSCIRVEADELTYNLHIILRFELERAMLSGDLDVRDVPGAWNDKMKDLLGITPGSDKDGCLQDIHWSIGIFGYFPTYALGNLYAAQFFEQAERDVPGLSDAISTGDYKPLLDWLRENIHRHGRRYRAGELVKVVTGKPLSIKPFVNRVTEKFTAVYGV